MTYPGRTLAQILLLITIASMSVWAEQKPTITAVWTDKARYAPGDSVQVEIDFDRRGVSEFKGKLQTVLQDRGIDVQRTERNVLLQSGQALHQRLAISPPNADFRGYRVEVRLLDTQGHVVSSGATAVDVSSSWRKFPRYGYIAQYDSNVPVESWIAQLNRYHIDGLQFYDFQHKHHVPAPPDALLKTGWHDLAGRSISGRTVQSMLRLAKERNMVTMAYNASYAAFPDSFHDGSGVELKWAAWTDQQASRTEQTTKSLQMPKGWPVDRLLYMNQDDPGWQNFIFAKMQELFMKLPFDGWHVDTYGDRGAFAWDRTPIDYFAGFPRFATAAKAALHKPILLNTVGAGGQVAMANTGVEFVYSELWPEDHPTYGSILQAADEVHSANPAKGLVFAAYLHKGFAERLRPGQKAKTKFNTPAVLLVDATIFAAGASHVELGDGDRMLSSPYFPADTQIVISNELRPKLQSYYDFLVAYQNYLRDELQPSSIPVTITNARQTASGEAGAVWTIAKHKGSCTMVNLINLTGLTETQWRDDTMNYPAAPTLKDVRLKVATPEGPVLRIGWASPDIDQGKWHPIEAMRSSSTETEIVLPQLRYWTLLVLQAEMAGSQPRGCSQ